MTTLPWLHPARVALIEAELARRILVIDGATGTMLQGYKLDEAGYRGERFSAGLDCDIHLKASMNASSRVTTTF